MATVDEINSDVKSAYDLMKKEADTALTLLKTFSSEQMPEVDYLEGRYLYHPNFYIPIQKITGADDVISEINKLIPRIAAVSYVPPNNIPNFQMEDHKIWRDAFADKIESSLSSYLNSMGIPNASFQNAIFNESYDRNMQILNDNLDLADTKVGARGFTYPNDMVTSLKLDAQQKYTFDRTQVSRDITKLVTEWARQNYQFAIEKGIQFEQFHADFTYKYCTAFVSIYKDMVLASIERFKADLARYIEPIKALVEAAKLPVEVEKINADIGKANAELATADNKLQIDEAVAKFNTSLTQAVTTFSIQVKALESVAKETAQFIQSASRSVIGIKK
jgi:hypothetical protein